MYRMIRIQHVFAMALSVTSGHAYAPLSALKNAFPSSLEQRYRHPLPEEALSPPFQSSTSLFAVTRRNMMYSITPAVPTIFVAASSANAGLLDDYGTDPKNIEKKVAPATAQVPNNAVGKGQIDPTLRSSYYYPTAKKRYLPRIQKLSQELVSIPDAIAESNWELLEDFSKTADNAVLPLQLYQSSLDGQGLSLTTDFAKKMKADALAFQIAYQLYAKALQSRNIDSLRVAVANMAASVSDYRTQGRLTDDLLDSSQIPSLEEMRRMAMRRPTMKQYISMKKTFTRSRSPPRMRLIASYSNVSPHIGTVRIVHGSVVDYGFDHFIAAATADTSTIGDGKDDLKDKKQDSLPVVLKSAIVNAANEGCLGGGGIDGAISSAGGFRLRHDRLNLPIVSEQGSNDYFAMRNMFAFRSEIRCPTGEAVLTGPNDYGRLHVPYVIHAVGPDYSNFRGSQGTSHGHELLNGAYQESLDRALEHGIQKVGFSLLSAGIFRAHVSLLEILQVSIDAIQSWAPLVDTQGSSVDDGNNEKLKADAAFDPDNPLTAPLPPSPPPSPLPGQASIAEITLCGFTREECETLLEACRHVLGSPSADNSPVTKKQKSDCGSPMSIDTEAPVDCKSAFAASATHDDEDAHGKGHDGNVRDQDNGRTSKVAWTSDENIDDWVRVDGGGWPSASGGCRYSFSNMTDLTQASSHVGVPAVKADVHGSKSSAVVHTGTNSYQSNSDNAPDDEAKGWKAALNTPWSSVTGMSSYRTDFFSSRNTNMASDSASAIASETVQFDGGDGDNHDGDVTTNDAADDSHNAYELDIFHYGVIDSAFKSKSSIIKDEAACSISEEEFWARVKVDVSPSKITGQP
ncbi:hypothetical protein MPSEU_000556900 [Mayamaea pseudoterrestris]|nr:hypothetical protein MPSEU_000556900 [Mayamaea pseudoterrestris]